MNVWKKSAETIRAWVGIVREKARRIRREEKESLQATSPRCRALPTGDLSALGVEGPILPMKRCRSPDETKPDGLEDEDLTGAEGHPVKDDSARQPSRLGRVARQSKRAENSTVMKTRVICLDS
ncbi:hypothetical protein [Phaffia rhodozyma]|uniref:Uncharacterized protein n=1 Tax=Phaffia rhodozyma TaxID=264483 RepID=A0A0F7SXD3_PHARH|nr:hypothetical protein [Phaffia rhodozyma]